MTVVFVAVIAWVALVALVLGMFHAAASASAPRPASAPLDRVGGLSMPERAATRRERPRPRTDRHPPGPRRLAAVQA